MCVCVASANILNSYTDLGSESNINIGLRDNVRKVREYGREEATGGIAVNGLAVCVEPVDLLYGKAEVREVHEHPSPYVCVIAKNTYTDEKACNKTNVKSQAKSGEEAVRGSAVTWASLLYTRVRYELYRI